MASPLSMKGNRKIGPEATSTSVDSSSVRVANPPRAKPSRSLQFGLAGVSRAVVADRCGDEGSFSDRILAGLSCQ
jgi:hypothetical protein